MEKVDKSTQQDPKAEKGKITSLRGSQHIIRAERRAIKSITICQGEMGLLGPLTQALVLRVKGKYRLPWPMLCLSAMTLSDISAQYQRGPLHNFDILEKGVCIGHTFVGENHIEKQAQAHEIHTVSWCVVTFPPLNSPKDHHFQSEPILIDEDH